MYVCICNAIRETDLRLAATACRGSAEVVYASLGKTPQCGLCLEDAERILSNERTLRGGGKICSS